MTSAYCTKCDLYLQSRVNCLLGDGNPQARIIFVGEAPGADEEQSGKPFTGPSGKLLNRLLEDAGLNRAEVFITNTVRCRPPKNATPTPKHLDACREYLDAELAGMRPEIIVPLGGTPLQIFVGKHKKITDCRGKVFWNEQFKCKVIPTFHPAYLLRVANNIPVAIQDMKTIAAELRGEPTAQVQLGEYSFISSIGEWRELLALLLRQEVLAFDIETTHLFWYKPDFVVKCIGFAWKEGQAVCIPLLRDADPMTDKYAMEWAVQLSDGESFCGWTGEEWNEIRDGLASLFAQQDKTFVGHNAKFDALGLSSIGVEIKGTLHDTMLMHHILEPGMKHGLDDTTLFYTNMGPYWKDLEKYKSPGKINIHKKAPPSVLWKYNGCDNDATLRTFHTFSRTLPEQNLADLYYNHTVPVLNLLRNMEHIGIGYDFERRDVIRQRVYEEIETHEKKTWEYAGQQFNVSSPDQLSDVLFKQLKIIPPKNTQTPKGKQSTKKDVLQYLSTTHPIIDEIMQYRTWKKLQTDFVDGIEQWIVDGKVHPVFKIHGTVTGRISAANPPIHNIPRGDKIRPIFIPLYSDHVAVYADYSAIELRVIAYISGEPTLISVFENGQDPHVDTASVIFDIPKEAVSEKQRDKAKTYNYALLYGAGIFQLARVLKTDENTVKTYNARLTANRPVLARWTKDMEFQAKHTGFLRSPFGRVFKFYGAQFQSRDIDFDVAREAVNYPIQSTASDITARSLVRIGEAFSRFGGYPIIWHHDGIICTVPEKYADEAKRVMKGIMELPIPELGGIVIPADVGIGRNWYDASQNCKPKKAAPAVSQPAHTNQYGMQPSPAQ